MPKRNLMLDETMTVSEGGQLPGSLSGGARRDRTDDLMLAKHALSQLSYGPFVVCGPSGPRTSRQLGAAFAASKA